MSPLAKWQCKISTETSKEHPRRERRGGGKVMCLLLFWGGRFFEMFEFFTRNMFVVFLNSPCRQTVKNAMHGDKTGRVSLDAGQMEL
jgi:hypothetical protein